MPRGLKTFWIHTTSGLRINAQGRSLDDACKKYNLGLSDVKSHCVIEGQGETP
jgi:hypothetical protein